MKLSFHLIPVTLLLVLMIGCSADPENNSINYDNESLVMRRQIDSIKTKIKKLDRISYLIRPLGSVYDSIYKYIQLMPDDTSKYYSLLQKYFEINHREIRRSFSQIISPINVVKLKSPGYILKNKSYYTFLIRKEQLLVFSSLSLLDQLESKQSQYQYAVETDKLIYSHGESIKLKFQSYITDSLMYKAFRIDSYVINGDTLKNNSLPEFAKIDHTHQEGKIFHHLILNESRKGKVTITGTILAELNPWFYMWKPFTTEFEIR